MIMEFKQLKNGDCKSNTGIKELSFDPETLELRPVLFRIYSGYQPGRGTVQGVLPGDIVAQCHWNTKETNYRIYRYGSDDVDINKQAELWIQLRTKHIWMNDWLEPSGRSETIIPEHVIPVDDYLTVKVKKARIQNCLDRFGLNEFSVNSFMDTKKNDLQLVPKPLQLNLDVYLPEEEHLVGSLVSIRKSEVWYGSAGIGRPAVKLEQFAKYSSKSNYAHEQPEEHPGEPGIKGWKKWKYLVQIESGIYEKDHSSYGMSLKVWENGSFVSLQKEEKKSAKKSKKSA